MKNILVTRPFLPPKEAYRKYLDQIWESQWLTNMGPLSKKLEEQLTDHLNVKYLHFVTNGTIALQMAIKALELSGEIITTPFSFVATTSSIVWEGCRPVFVDIDPKSFNIDPSKIEEAITDKTSAILATHVYGNPCDVEAIQKIAEKHNLKVIYDGAHAFGVTINGRSVYEYGDISICSLHATKLYHSGEGGLVITQNGQLAKKLHYIRNFGVSGHDSFAELGINGKNSEMHAAMGLANFDYIESIHRQRKKITETYHNLLKDQGLIFPEWHSQATKNYAYLPILFRSEEQLLKVVEYLKQEHVQTRRYFYPSLASVLPYLEPKHLSITDDIAKRILCLPLYYCLTVKEVKKIVTLIKVVL